MPSPPPSPFKTKWKGKAKASDIDDEFVDLNPAVTYRHLLADNLGVRDPFRVISLCDLDAFYAACEMVRLQVFDKPLVVLQWQALIAVNYPARWIFFRYLFDPGTELPFFSRTYGITRMMKIDEAKAKCPELVVVHVATYKEGEKEPGYWENVDNRTHKVWNIAPLFIHIKVCRSPSIIIAVKVQGFTQYLESQPLFKVPR